MSNKKKGAKDKAPVVVEVVQPIIVEPEPEPVVIQLSGNDITHITLHCIALTRCIL